MIGAHHIEHSFAQSFARDAISAVQQPPHQTLPQLMVASCLVERRRME